MDLTLTGRMLNDDDAWFEHGDLIRGGVRAAPGALEVAWEAYRPYPEGMPREYLDTAQRWLVLTRIDADSGEAFHQMAAVFPEGELYFDTSVNASGFGPQGFVAALASTSFIDRFLLMPEGMLDQASHTPLDDIDRNTMGYPAHVAWDGEAYLIELGNLDGQWAMRRSATGEPLLAPTRYGSLSSRSYTGYDLGYKTSTNPVSGVTYAFAASSTRWLTGHTRDGQRLPWIPETGSLQLPPVEGDGVLPMSGASAPGVAVDPEGGAWIVWAQSTTRLRGVGGVQHVALDGTLGPVLWFSPPPEDPGEPWRFALHAKSGSQAMLASATGAAIQVYEILGGEISAPRPLVEINPSENGVVRDFREMHLVSDGDDTLWLVTQTNVYTRVLKVAPGCVYPMEPSPAE